MDEFEERSNSAEILPDEQIPELENASEPMQEAPPVQGAEPPKPNHMATASMIMGIISIVTSCCCIGGWGFGGLAILFALLSNVDDQMDHKAKVGLTTGIIGLVLGAILTIVIVVLITAGGTPSFPYKFHSMPDFHIGGEHF